jgi:hypothetical protein
MSRSVIRRRRSLYDQVAEGIWPVDNHAGAVLENPYGQFIEARRMHGISMARYEVATMQSRYKRGRTCPRRVMLHVTA